MTLTALVLVASASLFTANAADKKKDKSKKTVAAPVTLQTSSDSLSYAAGMGATRGLVPFLQQSYMMDTAYMADFVRGYEEAFAQSNSPQGVAHAAGALIAKMVESRIYPSAKKEFAATKDSVSLALFNKGFLASLANDTTFFTTAKAEDYQNETLTAGSRQWLADNAKKPGVKVLPSGLQYKVLTEGHGEIPKSSDEVEVIYEGRLTDGTVFDATSKHKGVTTDKFNAGRLIKGWTEALTMMPVGSKWQIYIPQELAYGKRGAGQIPPYSTLVFDLELVSIVKPEVKTTAPEKLADNVAIGTEKKAATKTAAKATAKKSKKK